MIYINHYPHLNDFITHLKKKEQFNYNIINYLRFVFNKLYTYNIIYVANFILSTCMYILPLKHHMLKKFYE